MAAIQRSRRLERFIYSVLTINVIALLLNNLASFAFKPGNSKTLIENITFDVMGVANIVFILVFCAQMESVNKQLAQFLEMVSDRMYPKKTITVVLVIYLIVLINYGGTRLLDKEVFDVSAKYTYIASYLRLIYYQLFFFGMSLTFIFLVDFKHMPKKKKKMKVESASYLNVNFTMASSNCKSSNIFSTCETSQKDISFDYPNFDFDQLGMDESLEDILLQNFEKP